jgi:putative ABC transport system substrate-binding protein
MRRREFVLAVAGVTAHTVLARAQRNLPLVGFLGAGSVERSRVDGLQRGLSEAGYVINKTIAIEYLWGEGRYDRLSSLAKEFVDKGVDVIVAGGLPAALAAKAATATVPVVFVSGADPVTMGLVPNLSRPGGNLTGITLIFGALGAKRVELLCDLVPGARTITILANSRNPNLPTHLNELQIATKALGRQARVLTASDEKEIPAAFANLGQGTGQALLVSDDPVYSSMRGVLVELAARSKVPAIYFIREFADDGGLMSYGPNFPDAYRLAGLQTAQILRGAAPASLPVQQPTKFELVINMKTARSLGLAVPSTLLARADDVIE